METGAGAHYLDSRHWGLISYLAVGCEASSMKYIGQQRTGNWKELA